MAEDADHSEALATLCAITGVDEAAGLLLLQACNYRMEDAVNLHFASADMGGGGGGGGGTGGGMGDFPSFPDEEAEVRAPLPSKFDRLYGNVSDPRLMAAATAAQYGLNQAPKAAPPVDVFRDFKAEGQVAGSGPSGSGLSQLFKPPDDLKFEGDFEMAKMRAAQEGKWLLCNLQSNNEFDSHRLNRDTWNQPALKELLLHRQCFNTRPPPAPLHTHRGMFLFFQEYDSSPDGQKLCQMYKASKLPTTMVLDPNTGANLYNRIGFIGAEKLIEDLVPFMDNGPSDPGAGMMAHQMGLKRKAQEVAAMAAAMASGGGAGRVLSDEEQMNLMIARSLEGEGGGGSGSVKMAEPAAKAGALDDLDDLDEAEIWEQIRAKEAADAAAAAASSRTPEQVRADAASHLPPEPEASSSDVCRVAVRLATGRIMRRFNKGDTVQAIRDYVLSESVEAAGGRAFDLVPSIPGAQPLSDVHQKLGDADVDNAMLFVKFQ
ncbi:hypothetical protein FOA52_003270 [Chlamydomonas sp. UWO 241]|nr:hypothetical protein FOA52_003270 [Chlamydomonas sp. UWO 241]